MKSCCLLSQFTANTMTENNTIFVIFLEDKNSKWGLRVWKKDIGRVNVPPGLRTIRTTPSVPLYLLEPWPILYDPSLNHRDKNIRSLSLSPIFFFYYLLFCGQISLSPSSEDIDYCIWWLHVRPRWVAQDSRPIPRSLIQSCLQTNIFFHIRKNAMHRFYHQFLNISVGHHQSAEPHHFNSVFSVCGLCFFPPQLYLEINCLVLWLLYPEHKSKPPESFCS